MRSAGIRVMIAAGGSGGHIFPAIALGRSLRSRREGIDVMYIGSGKALDKRIFEREGARYATLSANKLPYGMSPEIMAASVKLAFDICRVVPMMLSYRPDIVVGFGGYVSFPVVFIAGIFGIPRLVHEQNLMPGRANKALFNFADRIAVSFRETKASMDKDSGKVVFTGNPVRPEVLHGGRKDGPGHFGLSPKKFTVLVIGGSQGATLLSRAFIDALRLMDAGRKSSVQVVHITGVKDYEWVLKAYEALEVESRVYSFIDRIEEAYGAADLVITRSGASALFELAALRKPMILIPYPYAKSHQLDNALAFAKHGAAIVMEEAGLKPEALRDCVTGLMDDTGRMRSMAEAAGNIAVPDASARLAEEVVKLAGRR
ncbi:MAG: undecaprenyldiphospho-muramoylpentapeptide beta-N-acetylglucosaminyltransferase [Candidatus Omnitrophica bacterium]|nr:undecaprenyldiphospho-muramoylpentapeptide beta-N-acetylglucosaminyltransferase [Candidatus Omnitrophota bacterium]